MEEYFLTDRHFYNVFKVIKMNYNSSFEFKVFSVTCKLNRERYKSIFFISIPWFAQICKSFNILLL